MAWVDYKKAYDFVLHSWISVCIKLFGIANNVRNFLEKSMEQSKLSLTSNGEGLGEVDKKRGIFQAGSLSALLFVLSMVPLSLILRKVNASYELKKKEYRLNHLLFMCDLKLFSKSEEQVNSLVKEVEKGAYTYLGIVVLDKIKDNQLKEKAIKEYKRNV